MQKIPVHPADIVNDGWDAVDRPDLFEQIARHIRGFPRRGRPQGLLNLFLMCEQGIHFLFNLVHGRVDFSREAAQELELGMGHAIGFHPRHRLDAPDPGGNGALAHNPEQADLARRARVRAPAQLHGIPIQLPCPAPDLNHPDGVPILVTEKLHHIRAALDIRMRDFRPRDPRVFQNPLVDQTLDIGDLPGRERRAVEIES